MDIRSLHETELEILELFADVCRREGLSFYLTAGTLLGAVRHQGFIPWDDDIDAAMPRADYERLRAIASRAFPCEYFWQDEFSEQFYPFPFAKLRKRNTLAQEEGFIGWDMEQGICIDIFPLDAPPDSDRITDLFFRAEKAIAHALRLKLDGSQPCAYTKHPAKAVVLLVRRLPVAHIKRLRRALYRLEGLFAGGSMLITTGGAHGWRRESARAVWFEETVQLPFEGSLYPCPAGWDAFLTNMYGDYMTPQGQDGRDAHFMQIDTGTK